MIGSIRGKVLNITGSTVLVELSSGLGYEVEVPTNILSKLPENEECFLYIHHVVREDAELLYGFDSTEARLLFREVTKISGVGPKIAFALLSTFDLPTFVEVISQERLSALVATPGVGKKTAERIIVELKDRIAKLHFAEKVSLFNVVTKSKIVLPDTKNSSAGDSQNIVCAQALEGMLALGFARDESMKAIKNAYQPDMSLEDLLNASLACFGSKN